MFTSIGLIAVIVGAYLLYRKYDVVVAADIAAIRAEVVKARADVAALVAKAKAII